MMLRYPGIQNAVLDQEDDQHNIIPGAWRREANMADVENITKGNRDTIAAKKQCEYLKLYNKLPSRCSAMAAVYDLAQPAEIKMPFSGQKKMLF